MGKTHQFLLGKTSQNKQLIKVNQLACITRTCLRGRTGWAQRSGGERGEKAYYSYRCSQTARNASHFTASLLRQRQDHQMTASSSQAAQRRAANSLLPLNLSTRLIGQPPFHSTSCPLNLHIVCFPVGRRENEAYERERKLW